MLKLTYPKSHQLDDIKPLFEKFKRENPDVYTRWYEISVHLLGNEKPTFDPAEGIPEHEEIRWAARQFLKSNADVTSVTAATMTIADFQTLIRDEARRDLATKLGK